MHWNNTKRVRGKEIRGKQRKGKCDSFGEGPKLDTGKMRSIYNLRVDGCLSIMLRDRVHNSFTWPSRVGRVVERPCMVCGQACY